MIKRKYILLIMVLTSTINMSGQVNDTLQCNSCELSIKSAYEAGQRTIGRIIQDNDLTHHLEGYAYAGFFTDNFWVIIKKEKLSYLVYVSYRNNEMKQLKFNLSNKELTTLFEWINTDQQRIYNVSNDLYSPIYYYFILFDDKHQIKIEFNANTMIAYKSSQKGSLLQKELPFTKEQFNFMNFIMNSHF